MEELIGTTNRTHNPVTINENTWMDDVEQWMKFELRIMLDQAMAEETHYYLYGIWYGPPDPVKYPWTIEGVLADQLFQDWIDAGNGLKSLTALGFPDLEVTPTESKPFEELGIVKFLMAAGEPNYKPKETE